MPPALGRPWGILMFHMIKVMKYFGYNAAADDDDGDDDGDDDDDDDVEVGRLTEGGIGRRRLVTLMAVERK